MRFAVCSDEPCAVNELAIKHRLCSSDLVKETLGTWLEPTGDDRGDPGERTIAEIETRYAIRRSTART